MPAGRPSEYKEEYAEAIIDHMAAGGSIEEFAGKMRISKQSIYNWKEKFPEFLDAINVGTEASHAFWAQVGRDLATGRGDSKDGNPTAWIFNMKNRFKWTDRQDMTTDGEKIEGVMIYKPEKHDEE